MAEYLSFILSTRLVTHLERPKRERSTSPSSNGAVAVGASQKTDKWFEKIGDRVERVWEISTPCLSFEWILSANGHASENFPYFSALIYFAVGRLCFLHVLQKDTKTWQHQGRPTALVEPDAAITKSLDSFGKPGGSHYRRLYVGEKVNPVPQTPHGEGLDLQHVYSACWLGKYHDWISPKDKQGRAHFPSFSNRRTLKQKKKNAIRVSSYLVGFLYELPPICLQQEQVNRCKGLPAQLPGAASWSRKVLKPSSIITPQHWG
ncbi:hypothetical protein PAAG_12109 [Paracoccidioides lutzii Pb01]|uniref:Uncharacterized protein n=1 Tax=Paracoccidioides lutzii (strain ATCC MYA-826 / Pb01) TaxID=502779 RepID=A0A0A2V072_PARBA|nr:hypothetical protein PAAG_12109 [Paracoccidioides lutzii Pb01]KGQ01166.1 hypothetical protein PAAG_12109 [Paracoccidioides lutzii Pb01]